MLTYVLYRLLNFYELIIFVYCIMTWLPSNTAGWLDDLRSALAALAEPYLGLFRSLPLRGAGIDFTPIVAVLALEVLGRLLITIF